ncbi:MAG: hypothetical protein GQ574_08205 [Crocinitomix sp.]|nr:hypothetical protein [Crocinitomix sp.]
MAFLLSDTFAVFHYIIILFLMAYIPFLFMQFYRSRKNFARSIVAVEIFAFLLLGQCFMMYEISSFQDEKYFSVFAIITLLSVLGYGLNKIIPHKAKVAKLISLTFLGTLFWLCLLTAIKFGPYLPFVWFPIYGLYALAPIIIGIITLAEIRYQGGLSSKLNALKIIGLGLIPIILLQILMNFFTPYMWEFIKIFEPSNQSF